MQCLIYASDKSYVETRLQAYLDYAPSTVWGAFLNAKILPIHSDPTLEDTDGDKFIDSEDENPLIFDELKNYFIAYDREGKELYEQARWMMEWAYDNENVEIFYLHTIADFVDCWNNKIPQYANSIHLYLHGTREKEFDKDDIDFFTPFLQFYNEEMVPGTTDFDILTTKYI